MENMENIQNRLKDAIWHVFRKYEMVIGEPNKRRMEKLYTYCMNDIVEHNMLETGLLANDAQLEFYIIQSIMYLINIK